MNRPRDIDLITKDNAELRADMAAQVTAMENGWYKYRVSGVDVTAGTIDMLRSKIAEHDRLFQQFLASPEGAVVTS